MSARISAGTAECRRDVPTPNRRLPGREGNLPRVFGINGPEFILLLIIGLLVIGPSRLPEYTQKLANIVKEVRRMASGAREQIKEEVGIDIDDVDWKKYDPRQYDPRRIIREALLEDDTKPVSAGAPAAVAAAEERKPVRVVERLPEGVPAPFDTEAT